MDLSSNIKKYIDKSVLCWLATSYNNIPNVSPKEIFTYTDESHLIIANIASPQSVKNIKHNSNVCVSFIDVFIQKGYQLKGKAEIIDKKNAAYNSLKVKLVKMTEGKFPIASIIKIEVTEAKPIIAPKYILYPETSEAEQINEARKRYAT